MTIHLRLYLLKGLKTENKKRRKILCYLFYLSFPQKILNGFREPGEELDAIRVVRETTYEMMMRFMRLSPTEALFTGLRTLLCTT